MSQQITIQGTEAINVSDLSSGGNVPSVTLSKGTYSVSIESDVKFHDQQWPLNQVVIFNCAPLVSGDSDGWYHVVDGSKPIQIDAEDGQPIYAALLDQVTSADNTGSATVTFTELPSGGCLSGTQTVFLDPSLKLIMVSSVVQSSAMQTLVVKDSDGKEIINWQKKSSHGGEMTQMGNTSFKPSGNGNYTVELTANSGILRGSSNLNRGNETYIESVTFATNDGGCNAGDQDFNDTVVQFFGFRNLG